MLLSYQSFCVPDEFSLFALCSGDRSGLINTVLYFSVARKFLNFATICLPIVEIAAVTLTGLTALPGLRFPTLRASILDFSPIAKNASLTTMLSSSLSCSEKPKIIRFLLRSTSCTTVSTAFSIISELTGF